MERETRKFNLPSEKKEVEIKTYFNILESREIQKSFLGKNNLPIKEDELEASKVDLNFEQMTDYQDQLIKQGVVNYDGSGKDIIERILSLQNKEDLKDVLDAIEIVR